MDGRRKKIGLVGWWGGKNEGDIFILEALKQSFGKEFIIKPVETPFEIKWTTKLMLNRLDFLIIGGGGLFTENLPPPFNTFREWGRKIKVPMGFLGVGIQEMRPDNEETFRQIAERSNFFIVRDSGSYDIARRFSPNVIKASDLSFLYPRRVVKESSGSSSIGVNLRIWDFDKRRTYDNDAWTRSINSLLGEKETIPLSFLEGLEDALAMKNIEGNQNTVFDINIYKKIGVMIGMRLHSMIFAVQNLIPVIGIAYTPKVKRFFGDMGMEEYCLGLHEYEKLKEVFDEVMTKHKEISETLREYCDQANIAISGQVEKIKAIIQSV